MSIQSEYRFDRMKKPWTILITCFVIITLVDIFSQIVYREILPLTSKFFLSKLPGMFVYLIPALYFSRRYGFIKFRDVIPKGSDFVVLFFGIILAFIQAALVAMLGTSGPHTVQGKSLLQLPKIEIYLILFSSLVIGPFFEELLLFRKYIIGILKQNYSVLLAVIATSFLETALHIGFILDWPLDLFRSIRFFILFVFLSLIYLKSNLGISFITHSLINASTIFLRWR
jgi:membrane protease YdiL (CAAX protease family)